MSFSQGASEFENELKRVGQDGEVQPRLTRLVQDPQGRFRPSPSATTASSSRSSKRGRGKDDSMESFPTQRVKRPMYRGTFASRKSVFPQSDRMDFEYIRPPSPPRVHDTEQLHIEETRQPAGPSAGRRKDNSYEGSRKQSPDHLPATGDAGKTVRGGVSEGSTDNDVAQESGGAEEHELAAQFGLLQVNLDDDLSGFDYQFSRDDESCYGEYDSEIEIKLV